MYKKVCDFVDNTHTICTNFERIEFNLNIHYYEKIIPFVCIRTVRCWQLRPDQRRGRCQDEKDIGRRFFECL